MKEFVFKLFIQIFVFFPFRFARSIKKPYNQANNVYSSVPHDDH